MVHPLRGRVASALLIAGLAAAAPAGAAEPDYARYASLLRTHVGLVARFEAGHPRGDTLLSGFDYAGYVRNPRPADLTLGAIRRDLLAVPPATMNRPERAAWAINLYNFLVIAAVLDHLQETGEPLRTVMELPGFFDLPRVTIEGREWSLNGFERHYLFADFARQGAPPPGLDPRLHFAIVCAARGCPPLLARPWRAATLEADLDANVARYLRAGNGLAVTARGRYRPSQIFEWYAADFGGAAGVRAFLERHGPGGLRRAFRSWGDAAVDGFTPWDWRLNQRAEPATE